MCERIGPAERKRNRAKRGERGERGEREEERRESKLERRLEKDVWTLFLRVCFGPSGIQFDDFEDVQLGVIEMKQRHGGDR
jgi:hypothetical protein